jgi:putative transposase
MTQKVDEDEAIIRYLVVCQVCAAVAAGVPKTIAVEEVAGRPQLGRGGRPRLVGVRTLWRWLGQWAAGGLDGLRAEPRQRPGSGLPEDFLTFLDERKTDDPTVSIPEVIRHARVIGVIADDARVDRTTVWRECRRRGLPTRRRDPSKRSLQRPWRYPHRMQCVIADGKHFKVGSRRAARVAVIFLDNASRFVLGAVVGTAESAELALRGLLKVIRRWGLMTCLYVDLGFDTKDLARATASLDVNLILGTKSYPEARGCIERFNRTLAEQLLCGWPGNPAIDPELMALELRLEHWASEMYNHTPHEGLKGNTPAERFHSDSRSLTIPESPIALEEAFVTSFDRTVRSHNCVSVDGTLFELPLGYSSGSKIDVYRNMITGVLCVSHQGRRVAIHPADLTANAYQERSAAKPRSTARSGRRTTAGDAAFERDHPPLVDDDGGYHDTD